MSLTLWRARGAPDLRGSGAPRVCRIVRNPGLEGNMSGYLGVVPRPGRDYKSKAEVLAAWNAGEDFIVSDYSSRWDGKPISKSGAARYSPGVTIQVRYKNLRSVMMIKNPGA